MFTGVTVSGPEEAPLYTYRVHRIANWRWRPNLEADVESHFAEWLEMAVRLEADALSMELRAQRDALLAASDPHMLPDFPQTDEQRAAWETYRQALRDVPEQAGFPFEVVWPDAPA